MLHPFYSRKAITLFLLVTLIQVQYFCNNIQKRKKFHPNYLIASALVRCTSNTEKVQHFTWTVGRVWKSFYRMQVHTNYQAFGLCCSAKAMGIFKMFDLFWKVISVAIFLTIACSQSLFLLLARATYIMVLHIPFVVNHTINATPPERLQH